MYWSAFFFCLVFLANWKAFITDGLAFKRDPFIKMISFSLFDVSATETYPVSFLSNLCHNYALADYYSGSFLAVGRSLLISDQSKDLVSSNPSSFLLF